MRIARWTIDAGTWLGPKRGTAKAAALTSQAAQQLLAMQNEDADAANAEIERLEVVLENLKGQRSYWRSRADEAETKLAASHHACVDRAEALEKERDAARAEAAARSESIKVLPWKVISETCIDVGGDTWGVANLVAGHGIVAAHNAQERAAFERGRKEAGPVDDGKRWGIWYQTIGGEWLRPVEFCDEYRREFADGIVFVLNRRCGSKYEARMIDPNHVHDWSDVYTGLDRPVRRCTFDGCPARQVAEWKDEP